MVETRPDLKMPELLVIARAFAVGIVGVELFRVAFLFGSAFVPHVENVLPWVQWSAILFCAAVIGCYGFKRKGHLVLARLIRSLRFDLLIVVAIGGWTDYLVDPWLKDFHEAIKKADTNSAVALLVLMLSLLVAPLVGLWLGRSKRPLPQLYFIPDEDVKDSKEDVLDTEPQAKSFAEVVLASGAHSGLVFGVEGPWGVGKTTFINLAARHWQAANDEVIVCRFEPLRYASEPDLAERLIRDLSAAIDKEVFVPELRPTASRYYRLLKGKADFSFLGFKLSLEPSSDTIDELLDDIDGVLKRINRRVIIVIDDLDRLDPKTVNNVLFATRRTFKLSQATYVLCYDTEVLVAGKEDGENAREFLEKFVTVKLSLFVDSSKIRQFLRRDWQKSDQHLASVPSDTMFKLGEVLSELDGMLGNGEVAARYLPLMGDLRKVKRFVNAMLMMQMERTRFGQTDFNKRDLINLMLLHLNYPGQFRRIYAEETEGRTGSYSVRRDAATRKFVNSPKLSEYCSDDKSPAAFLLRQLFDVDTLDLTSALGSVDTSVLASRACFNEDSYRNLEKYLKLIVRFAQPERRETFVLYQNSVEKVRGGTPIRKIFEEPEFRLDVEGGENAHDQFWRVLVNQAQDLSPKVAEDAITTLIEYLPKYPTSVNYDNGLRQRSIYSLLRLLDRAGWGQSSGKRLNNTAENIIEIAQRILGTSPYAGRGIIQQLVVAERRELGWHDLMLFRLQCCTDRRGQIYNVQSSLIVHDDPKGVTTGQLTELTVRGMRKMSQQVFALFKSRYIEPQRNFMTAVDSCEDGLFWGETPAAPATTTNDDQVDAATRVAISRTGVKGFVIYQLSNPIRPTGSGVGCGYYDEDGANDQQGIARAMNDYVFDFCFNPDIREENIAHFLTHCLSHLSNAFFTGEDGLTATVQELPSGLNPLRMGQYWNQHRTRVTSFVEATPDCRVVSPNYSATYKEHLPKVFKVLDEMATKATEAARKPVDEPRPDGTTDPLS